MKVDALTFEGVSLRFGARRAIDRLDLNVSAGQVVGLLGRNGAGKTTSLRLALGMLYADEGRILTLGLDPETDALAVREQVSLLSEESHLYPWMTVKEILGFGRALHRGWDEGLAASLVESLDLDPGEVVRNLSRGTRAKVSLVLGVACRPRLLLLDDPTAGLDPLVRHEVLQGVLQSVSDEGGAVVYASHLVHDVERIADRVVVLDEGRVTLEGSLEGLKDEVRQVRAVFDAEVPRTLGMPGEIHAARNGRVLSVVVRGDAARVAEQARALGAAEVEIESLSLEEILIACLRKPGAREVERV